MSEELYENFSDTESSSDELICVFNQRCKIKVYEPKYKLLSLLMDDIQEVKLIKKGKSFYLDVKFNNDILEQLKKISSNK